MGIPRNTTGLIVAGCIFLILIPVLIWAWFAGTAIGNEFGVAMKGVPTPAYISAELEKEWGRPATVEEIAAVHQMLQSRHNEAMVNAGLTLGALYLIGHHGNL